MVGSRFYLLIALAVSCHALPKTAEDDVVPERQTMLLQHRAAFTKLSSTAFIAAMTSSGGSEEDCRTFADETIKDIEATITTTQAEINVVATGASCAAMGQDQVQAQTAKVAAAKAAVQNAETDAASKQRAKDTAASATFTVTFDLMFDGDANCRDPTSQESYQVVKKAADTAVAELATAKQTLVDAKAAVTAAELALANEVAQASSLKSACLCRAHKAQKVAMASASTATASHAADWKQAHELKCALDKTTTCTVPTCPTVTQQTLAAGVATADTEHCLGAPTNSFWGIDFYRVQVQGSMMNSEKFKAACTAKHPDLRPICASSSPNSHTRSLDSNGKQWCLVIPDHGTGRQWSNGGHNYMIGMTFGIGNFWSTGDTVPKYNNGYARYGSDRAAVASDKNGYTYCAKIAEDTVPLRCTGPSSTGSTYCNKGPA